jgi:hypothetical protein
MESIAAEGRAPPRFSAVLVSSFAAIAVVLAALGVCGVVAFSAGIT